MKQKEIIQIAAEQQVPKSTIEKDWVLGHILNTFYGLPEMDNLFVFKGGTCLRKCWFADYRFSEDLDFTLLDNSFPVTPQWIKSILKNVENISGARFHLSSLQPQQWKNMPQGYLLEIKYWGPDHHPNQQPLPVNRWLTQIHIDINFTEPLYSHVIKRAIIHPFSDRELISFQPVCYSLAELLAEKIRALQQRNRPKDIFDVYALSQSLTVDEIEKIPDLLRKKCEIKNLRCDEISLFVNQDKEKINQRHWKRALQYQIPAAKLPEFSSVYPHISEFVKRIMHGYQKLAE